MRRLAALLALAACGTAPAQAAYQTCGGQPVSMDLVRCPDGAIPTYRMGDAPAAAAKAPARTADSLTVFGIWRTNLHGNAYKSAVDVPGAYLLDVPAGLGSGDLTISPNGAFVWNGYTPMSGRWLKSDSEDATVILLDTAGQRRWKVLLAAGRLTITAGTTSYAGQR